MHMRFSLIEGGVTVDTCCRLKREEDRIAREIAEKEEAEARAVLEQAARSGKIKLPAGDKLDKAAILNQVRHNTLASCIGCIS